NFVAGSLIKYPHSEESLLGTFRAQLGPQRRVPAQRHVKEEELGGLAAADARLGINRSFPNPQPVIQKDADRTGSALVSDRFRDRESTEFDQLLGRQSLCQIHPRAVTNAINGCFDKIPRTLHRSIA